MRKAIYFRLLILTLIAILICSFISAFGYAIYTQNQTKEWLTKLTLATAGNYKNNTDVYSLSKAAGNNRITVIAYGGVVLSDSETDINKMENHAGRDEVEYANPNNVYITMRTSETLGINFMYASIKTDDGNILRLAHSYSGLLYNFIAQLPAIIIAVFTSLILFLFLTGRFTKTVTNPLEKSLILYPRTNMKS